MLFERTCASTFFLACHLFKLCHSGDINYEFYFAGRIGKDSSKEEMHDLYDFMNKIIAEK